jgi:hypothetical protein
MLSDEQLRQRELMRCQPDYVTLAPEYRDGQPTSHNEHFLVFEGADGSLMTIWTQACKSPDGPKNVGNVNHTMFSRSDDGGVTWARPKRIAGPEFDIQPPYMTSWAFPMVAKSGRVYVIWNQHQGVGGWIKFHTGSMAGIYSDDHGATWSEPQDIPMPHSPYDDPAGKIPPEWIVWQAPMRDLSGGYIIGYSHWLNPAVARPIPAGHLGWTWIESVVEFMRFENIDEDPEPKDLRIRYSAWGDKALRVPHWKDPLRTVTQEPSMVRLPDGRLFCVMRTNSGYIWYSESADDGETWISPRPLLRKDFGPPIPQPVGPCPLYQLGDGRYVLFHNNNRGNIEGERSEKGLMEVTHSPRRPCYIALGEFRPGADQPLWFSDSKEFIDTGNYLISGEPGPSGPSLYASFTTCNHEDVLWHPDRNFFLLGKRVTAQFLADLHAPE